MIVDCPCRLTTFDEVARGGLFQFAIGDVEYIAIKVWSKSVEARLLLRPGHPEYQGRPAIERGAFAGEQLVEFSEPHVRPSLADVKLGNSVLSNAGDLVLLEDRVCIDAFFGGRPCFVDATTGEVIAASRHPAVIKRWAIVQIIDGRPSQPIFEWNGDNGAAHSAR